jgi:hypothetical protein
MSAVIKIICNIVIFSTNFFFPETLEMCPTPPILKCWACPATPKYKCPKCNIKSCSLDCVKRHKEEANCDGMRDKVKFVPMGQFKDMDVVNDFRLLEEVTKQVDK